MTASRTSAPDLPPLRVWLEPGYDHGRHAAWLLDQPGAFWWAPTRELALSQASVGMGWYRDWLARHGEHLTELWGRASVVEEVPATVVDGYERNAIFADDSRPVDVADVDTTIRRLEFARTDLLDLAARVDIFEAGGGRLATGDDREPTEREEADRERTADEVLRHLGAAEMWLASRVDPAARFTGADREGDVRTWLAGTRVWSMDQLRRYATSDGVLARVDGKGERWTLRKVLRRMLYHAIDHYRELDRRLARGEDRAARLRFSDARLTDVLPLVRLLRSVGWDRRTVDVARLGRAIDGSQAMVSAWDGEELIGFTRELGDGEFTATVSMVIVDPRWQGLGLADRLIRAILRDRRDVRFSLGAAPGLKPYYERLGFVADDSAMVIRPGT